MLGKKEILDAFNFRHACKAFDPDRKISDDDFNFILETGRLSPSSFGFEPWRFVVIQNADLREKLRAVTWGAQKQLPTSSHYVAILCRKGDMRYDSQYIQHIMRDVHNLPEDAIRMRGDKYRAFQEKEFRLLDSERTLFDWASKQAYIACGNMMTSAAMIGIDSCPVEGYDIDSAEAVLADAGVLDRQQFGLALMVAFGYRVDPQKPKTRQPMEDIVTWVR